MSNFKQDSSTQVLLRAFIEAKASGTLVLTNKELGERFPAMGGTEIARTVSRLSDRYFLRRVGRATYEITTAGVEATRLPPVPLTKEERLKMRRDAYHAKKLAAFSVAEEGYAAAVTAEGCVVEVQRLTSTTSIRRDNTPPFEPRMLVVWDVPNFSYRQRFAKRSSGMMSAGGRV